MPLPPPGVCRAAPGSRAIEVSSTVFLYTRNRSRTLAYRRACTFPAREHPRGTERTCADDREREREKERVTACPANGRALETTLTAANIDDVSENPSARSSVCVRLTLHRKHFYAARGDSETGSPRDPGERDAALLRNRITC